ncbi:MAG: alpha-hydroxy acid oxidase [Gammaproteobacteria bacterium]
MIPAFLKRLDEAVNGWCVGHSHNVNDLRKFARLRVPRPMFHYMDGAADDEVTLAANCSDFDRYELLPRYLVDVSEIDTRTTVMGADIALPVVGAPTGMSRLFNNDGELAVSRAMAAAGTAYSLSTVSTFSIEDVAAACSGPKWFQIYVFRDRTLVTEFVDRCKQAEFAGLILTVDVPVAGNRERDLRTGMVIPPKFSLASWLDFCLHPLWSLKYVLSQEFQLANVAHKAPVSERDVFSLVGYLNQQFDPSVDWDAAAWMIEQWDGPFAIKGICCVEDAVRAADIGASAVIVSNHGGRQLDTAPSPVSLIREVREAVGDRVEIICDGGIRRGTDVLKALALGADACMIGRAYLFGLGAAGEAGVARALELLHAEIRRDMALLGCTSIDQINGDYIRERT